MTKWINIEISEETAEMLANAGSNDCNSKCCGNGGGNPPREH